MLAGTDIEDRGQCLLLEGNDFLRTLSVFVNRLYCDRQANIHVQDVERLYTDLNQLGGCLFQKLERFQNDLYTLQEDGGCNNDTNSSYRLNTEHTLHRAGRPSYNISQEQLNTFDELGIFGNCHSYIAWS